jgi:Arc/MetJ-type ribon-helix-helix transcriptional regulator
MAASVAFHLAAGRALEAVDLATDSSTPPITYRLEYRTGMLQRVTTEQIAVRLPTEQLKVLDDLVVRGVYATRAAAVRAGIEALVELDRRRQDDRSIVEGYQRTPPTEAETAAALASLRDAIAEEPW